MNLFVETTDAGSPKAKSFLFGTPGLVPFVVLPEGPVRALFSQDGRAFAVAGVRFYELFAGGTALARGIVALDGNPATICSNGTAGFQLFVVSGGAGYIFNLQTNAFVAITDDDFLSPVVMGGFADGYFVALQAHSREFQISALEDGTDWSSLDVAQVSESSDDRLAFIVDHRELWFFGSKTTEPWVNTGAANFPYQPVPGTLIEHGILAPFSAQKLDNTVFWLGQNDIGAGIVWRAQGYTPQRVSTYALESVINSLSTATDAIAWTYTQAGHSFYMLYLPQAETTWCYDVSTGLWHERGRLLTMDPWTCTPHIGRCHTFGFGTHLVGSRTNGAIYAMRLDAYHDALIL